MALETTSAVVGLALPAINLCYKIIQAAPMAIQNEDDCAYLAGRLSLLRNLLGRLRLEGPEAAEALSGLCAVLRDAHELVDACQQSSAPRKLASSGDHAKMFSRVNGRIDSQLIQIQLCCQVDTSHRLDPIIPPAPTSIVAADVYKEGGNDHKRFESDATAVGDTAVEAMPQRTRNRLEDMIESKARWKKSATGRIVRVTLGIVSLNPGYVILAACGI